MSGLESFSGRVLSCEMGSCHSGKVIVALCSRRWKAGPLFWQAGCFDLMLMYVFKFWKCSD